MRRLAVLTIHEPWASAICRWPEGRDDGKATENREWPPWPRDGQDKLGLDPGDWLAIHAGRRLDRDAVEWIDSTFGVRLDPQPGAVLGLAKFIGLKTAGRAWDDPWFRGPIGWVFGEVRQIEPFEDRGRQKLWRLSAEHTALALTRAGLITPPHTCHARGCRTPCKPEHLMCRKHWSMVREDLQREVWRHYRSGQCDDKRPSRAWHEAADAAIRWVAAQEAQCVRQGSLFGASGAHGRGHG